MGKSDDSCLGEQSPPKKGIACTIARHLRGHWTVENGIFRVRDVSYNEDRLHGRKIGLYLSTLRNVAINVIRRNNYPFVPDAWRAFAARSDRGLYLLGRILEN